MKKVMDGDTLLVEIEGAEESVRLIGVNAPEKNHPIKPVEYLSREATQFMKRLAEGQKVILKYEELKRDKYGRRLAYVFLEDGRLVNAEIIKEGLAFAYTRYPYQRLEEFKKYEEEARRRGKGLWKDQGRQEWRWLLSMGRRPFKIYEMAGDLWAIEYDGFIKLKIKDADLSLELSHLRIWIHEYHEEDLKEVLLKKGWIEMGQDP